MAPGAASLRRKRHGGQGGSIQTRCLLEVAIRQAAGLTGAVRAMALRDFGPGAA
jgi:hypothetical protein